MFAYVCGNQRYQVPSSIVFHLTYFLVKSLKILHATFWGKSPTLNLQLANSARLTGWPAVSSDPPISTSQILRLQAFMWVLEDQTQVLYRETLGGNEDI